MRYQNLLDIDRWSAVQSQTLAKSETIATFDIRGLKPSNFYVVEAWLGSQRPTEDRVVRALLITGDAPPGATFTGGGGSQVGRILRIEPTITSVTVNAGDEVLTVGRNLRQAGVARQRSRRQAPGRRPA